MAVRELERSDSASFVTVLVNGERVSFAMDQASDEPACSVTATARDERASFVMAAASAGSAFSAMGLANKAHACSVTVEQMVMLHAQRVMAAELLK